MKITDIRITNTLGARRVALSMPTPIMLICGGNGAAKSSINESVRIAFSGVGLRVASKKEYPQLVSEGAKKGNIVVTTDAGTAGFALPCGSHAVDGDLLRGIPDALPYVLNAQGFAALTSDERRTFLFSLTDREATPLEVERRLVEHDCKPAKILQVLPMLRSGFPAACEFAKAEATKAKGAWQGVAGEKFGTKKGATWAAERPALDAAAKALALEALDKAGAAVAGVRAQLDATRSGIVHDLARYLKANRLLLNKMELLVPTSADALLIEYEREHGPLSDAAPMTEEQSNLLLSELLRAKEAERAARETAHGHIEAEAKALAADEITARAAGHFADATEWTAIADALAPDGIPAELLAQALKPINLALRRASLKTGWRQPTIDADMTIRAEGRMYPLHSVSEQWRIDAMIAAAIAELSGVKVLLLDGFDVLELADREKLLLWLDELAQAGAINTALINATLKAAPTGLPASITPLWIENGELIHL